VTVFTEAKGDVFEMEGDLICVLTNQVTTRRGLAVMGGGQAAQARLLFPGIDRDIGFLIQAGQPGFAVLGEYRRQDFGTYQALAHFPTKRHWADDSSLELIEESAQRMMTYLDSPDGRHVQRVLLPRPGCGLGNLNWEIQVAPLLARILDERVVVCSFPEDS